MKGLSCAIFGLALVAHAVSAQMDSLAAARLLIDEGRPAEALPMIERVLEDRPDSAAALLLRGVALVGSGREIEAEALFLDLTTRFPDIPEPFNNLAVLLARRGEYERSVEILKQALHTRSGYGVAYENLTRLSAKLAGRTYDRALGQESATPGAGPPLELLTNLDAGSRKVESVEPPAAENPAGGSLPTAGAPARRSADLASEPAAEPSTDDATILEFDAAGVVATIEAWARSWADRRADDHLEHYASIFEPAAGASRAAWEMRRRARIEDASGIAVDSIAVRQVGEAGAQARFTRSEGAGSARTRVVMTLDLVREAGVWKILRENPPPD